MRLSAIARFALVLGLAGNTVACTEPVASDLEDRDANLVADALQRAGIDATKELDPATEGRSRIVVPKGDTATAITVLREHDLPPRHAPGIADSVGKGSLVPSQLAEHAQFLAGLSGDLERTFASVDGVLGARVHLSVPMPATLGERPPEKSTASVLIKHTGATPPISDAAVRGIVAGAVSTIAPDSVTVVMISRPISEALPERPVAYLGPIAVTRRSAPWLRGAFLGAVLLVLALVSSLAGLWIRTRRLLAARVPEGDGA